MSAGRVAFVVVVTAASVLVACHSGSSASCDPVVAIVEPTQGHVLPGVAVQYQHHPPTSGRHYADAPAPGVHRIAIDERNQVPALERGWVILQYASSVRRPARRALERLASSAPTSAVLVAPATRIDDGRTVAFTAWQHRQLCDGVSVPAARAFIARFAGKPLI